VDEVHTALGVLREVIEAAVPDLEVTTKSPQGELSDLI
jgi:hypothetical protein